MSKIKVTTISDPDNDNTALTIDSSGNVTFAGDVDLSAGTVTGVSSGIVGMSVFTSSGTWTKATREAALGVTIKRVIVEVLGAGGGGSRHNSNAGSVAAGYGGAYCKKLIDVSAITTSTITIGSGGAGATSSGVAGTDGGDSVWSDGTNTLTASGGPGGPNSAATTPTLNTATGGDLNIPGKHGIRIDYVESRGGGSIYGDGGAYRYISNNPYPASGYGAGGGGGYQTNGETGTDGIVIVTEIAG